MRKTESEPVQLREPAQEKERVSREREPPRISRCADVFHYFQNRHLYFEVILLLVVFALLLRVCVGGGGYSGFQTPPMYGDFEAQRHWMEITLNLPIKDWYRNTTDNDLSYWGLDYPPLTAYHSALLGAVGQFLFPQLFELHSSRGYESSASKMFMRMTVLVSELLVFFPAAFAFVYVYYNSRPFYGKLEAISILLLCPPIILVDHGHFQYNTVCLGLVLWGILLVLKGRILLGSMFFCFALAFKQMALYYAPAFFFYLLGHSLQQAPASALKQLVLLGLVVIASLGICFSPWLLLPPEQGESFLDPVLRVFRRIFPFNRGLYEDKVANFWCTTGVVIKWTKLLPVDRLLQLCTLTTLLGFLPSGLLLLWRPTKDGFLHCLCISSLSFFLFSFQVHEKTILLPLLPLLCLSMRYPRLAHWASTVAAFSMFPLLHKDGQTIQYVAMQLFWWFVMGFSILESNDPRSTKGATPKGFVESLPLANLSALGMVGVHAADVAVRLFLTYTGGADNGLQDSAILLKVHAVLRRYPDIVLYMYAIFAAAHCGVCLLWLYYLQMTEVCQPAHKNKTD